MTRVLQTLRRRPRAVAVISELPRAIAGRLYLNRAILIAIALLWPVTAVAETTLDEARAGYDSTIDSLLPIWTRCLYSKQPVAEELKSGPYAMPRVVDWTVEWAIDGDRWHISKRSDDTRRSISYDGRSVWELAFDESNLDAVLAAEMYSLKTRSDFSVRIGPTPGMWLGLYFSIDEQQQSGASLRQMLALPSALCLGEVDIDGHPCVWVEVGFPTPSGEELPVSVWLDPNAGFLPRRIESRFSGREAPPDVVAVEAFRQITTKDGVRTWFPERMTRLNPLAETQLELVEVVAGARPSKELFHPRLPAGAPTFDMEDPDGLLARRSFLTKDQPPAEPTPPGRQKRTPTALPAEIVPIMPAHPARDYTWPQVLMAAGLLLLVVASWYFVKARA